MNDYHTRWRLQDAFSEALRDFGLTSEEIAVASAKIRTVSGYTGTYLAANQETAIDDADGIRDVLVQKFSQGYQPRSGAYSVSLVAGAADAAALGRDLERIKGTTGGMSRSRSTQPM